MTSGEEDFTKRMKGKMDLYWVKGVVLKDPAVAGCIPTSIEHIVRISHEQILGTALKTPTYAQCVPISVENDAIAYNALTNRFRVDIEAMSVGTIDVNVASIDATAMQPIDLSKVLGSPLSYANPVIARLTDGSAFIDPRDMSDRAARLVGKVYGSLDVLQQQATTKELLIQIAHQGVIKDPTQIRALTSSDQITAMQATAANLCATVTQAAKDRTISSVDATATPIQINKTWGASGNESIYTPATGKKARLKLICLELSADVDLGYRFGATGNIYYLRITAGPVVINFIGANVQGAANEDIYLYASGACTAKGHAIVTDVD